MTLYIQWLYRRSAIMKMVSDDTKWKINHKKMLIVICRCFPSPIYVGSLNINRDCMKLSINEIGKVTDLGHAWID